MLLDVAWHRWMLLDAVGYCWMLLDVAACCWMLLHVAGCCWMLLDVVGWCWMVLDVVGCCCDPLITPAHHFGVGGPHHHCAIEDNAAADTHHRHYLHAGLEDTNEARVPMGVLHGFV